LAIAMPLHAVMAVSGSMLWGRGRADIEWRAQAVVALLTATVLALAAQLTLAQFAWALCALYAVRTLSLGFALSRELKLASTALWHSLRAPLACSIALAGFIGLLDGWLHRRGARPAEALVTLLLVGAGVSLATLRLIGARLLGREMNPVLQRLPPRFQRWLGLGT